MSDHIGCLGRQHRGQAVMSRSARWAWINEVVSSCEPLRDKLGAALNACRSAHIADAFRLDIVDADHMRRLNLTESRRYPRPRRIQTDLRVKNGCVQASIQLEHRRKTNSTMLATMGRGSRRSVWTRTYSKDAAFAKSCSAGRHDHRTSKPWVHCTICVEGCNRLGVDASARLVQEHRSTGQIPSQILRLARFDRRRSLGCQAPQFASPCNDLGRSVDIRLAKFDADARIVALDAAARKVGASLKPVIVIVGVKFDLTTLALRDAFTYRRGRPNAS